MPLWNVIPDAPRRPEEVESLLAEEKSFLGRAKGSTCARCGFHSGKAMRGLNVEGKWEKVCPLCHAGADWSLAPADTPLILLPEVEPPRVSRYLHAVYRWLACSDPARRGTAVDMFNALHARDSQLASMMGVTGASVTTGLVCDAYWSLSPVWREGSRRILSMLRVAPPPELFANAYRYWKKKIYVDCTEESRADAW